MPKPAMIFTTFSSKNNKDGIFELSHNESPQQIFDMMKKHHSIVLTYLTLMIGTLALAFASCKKSPETIGNNLISDNNYIGVYHTDTTEIICHSYFDSIATGNATSALLGGMKDPVFGATEAGFYTQFRPSVAGQSFGNNAVMDSLVLQLCVSGYYGDTTVMQTVHAYTLMDSLAVDSTYYSYSSVATENIDLANSHHFYPHPKTKVHIIGTDTVTQAIIRIPLSQELGNYLMTLDTMAYSRPDLLKQYFKGLYVTCDPVSMDGAISYINLTNNTYTLLQLYYHDAATPNKPMRYNFYVTSSDVYFNHFDHDYTQGSSEFVSQMVDGQEALGQSTIYLQAMGGVRTWVRFPNLNHWTDSLEGCHLVVNEAKLILPASTMLTDSVYKAPTNFILLGFNADSTTYLLPDYYEGTGYFGGTYSSSNQSVTFRITEYLQSVILEKKDNHGLCLGINGAAYNASRLVINGPESNEMEKMRLEVTYSIVNE